MNITPITSINLPKTRRNTNEAQQRTNSSILSVKKSTSPNFGVLILDDLYNWGIKKANKSLTESAKKEINAIRQSVLDDVELLSKRQGVSRDTVKKIYGTAISEGGITPKYDGNEVGLNKVVGYSLEKFEILKRVVVPVLKSAEAVKTGENLKHERVPNGIILYGRPGSGKSFFGKSIVEHIAHKAKSDNLPIRTVTVSSEWWRGDTEKNLDAIRTTFNNARKEGEKQNKTVIFIDKLDDILTAENGENLRDELLKQTENSSKDGIVWLGAVSDVRDMPPQLLDKTRTDMFIEIDKTKSESESQALLKHFVANTGRASKYDEGYLYGYIRDSEIPFIPQKIKQIVSFADDELKMTKDYSTKRRGTYTAPIYNIQLMMGADYVSKYNKNKIVKPYDKTNIQIPVSQNIDVYTPFNKR